MGMFSWKCQCGVPIRSRCSTGSNVADWQSDCVAVEVDGELVASGEYDGYGRIETGTGDIDIFAACDHKVAWFHKKCWEAIGKPTSGLKRSKYDPDQGFYDPTQEVSWEDAMAGKWKPDPEKEDQSCPTCGQAITEDS